VRFIIAIVLFVVAFVGIGLGIAERTVFAEADRVTQSIDLESTAPVTVVDGSALNAFDGRQTLAILGGVQAAPSQSPSACNTWLCMRSVIASRGRWLPGRSTSTSWASRRVSTPRTSRRVVWGLSETIATFSPTMPLTSVDLPAFGRPAITDCP